MSNTSYLTNTVENYVRLWLSTQLPGHVFTKRHINLKSGGKHEFDAISEDNNIITGIKTNSYKTKGGKILPGKLVAYTKNYIIQVS
ncbi:hypothetical protein [Dehalococcoides mccartyi]|uniref:hypothetical protein n=1 Tax=Dehalococcoides mccartyi TaxID=61435 RepID=UPI0026F2FBA0|nr:hypothetical protein [Dehalococcoides mccartyi]